MGQFFFNRLYDPQNKKRWVLLLLSHLHLLSYSNLMNKFNVKQQNQPCIHLSLPRSPYQTISFFIFFIKFECFLFSIIKYNIYFARGLDLSNEFFCAWSMHMNLKITTFVTDPYIPAIVYPSYTWTVYNGIFSESWI